MKILETKEFPNGIKSIKYQHFSDDRGYFTETMRYEDINGALGLDDQPFEQCNESFSKAHAVRGLHFQWNPWMGKLVRVIHGNMIDMALDVRKGSPTFGQMFLYGMASHPTCETNDWLWVPPGFAHGCVFMCDTTIEYMCTGHWSPDCEASISPRAADIDWSECNEHLVKLVRNIIGTTHLITDKDKNGFTLAQWLDDKRSDNFLWREGHQYNLLP